MVGKPKGLCPFVMHKKYMFLVLWMFNGISDLGNCHGFIVIQSYDYTMHIEHKFTPVLFRYIRVKTKNYMFTIISFLQLWLLELDTSIHQDDLELNDFKEKHVDPKRVVKVLYQDCIRGKGQRYLYLN